MAVSDVLRKLIEAGWRPVAPFLVRWPLPEVAGSVSLLAADTGAVTLLYRAEPDGSALVEWLIEFGPEVPTEIILSTCRLAQTQQTD
jgi:hypothetical protein